MDSPVGKPRGKFSRESHRSLDPSEGKRDTALTALEKSARACPHSRRGLTPLGRLQNYPKIHVSTGEESSGSGTDSTQGLRHKQKWASSRLEGRTSWIYSSCGRCSRLTTGTSGTRSGGLRKGQSPCELHGCLSGFLSRRCRGLRPCVY